MHIVINARFLTQNITGVQRYAIELSRELIKLNDDITFVAPHNIIHQEIAKTFNVKIIGKKTGYYWEQIELPSYLKKTHKNALLLNFANMAPINYKNKIVTIHDVAPLRNPKWFSRRFSLTYKYLLPLIVRSSVTIVTDSEYSKKEINSLLKVDKHKITVVLPGVSQDFNHMVRDDSIIVSQPFVLSVSSPSPRKNVVRLIEAFSKMNLERLMLVIVGSENKTLSTQDLKDQIQSKSNITFTGPIDDEYLMALYRKAELFVYPSIYEGFGLPPLEAMACGCPCAVSKVTSLPEVCGDAAAYFDPYNTQDIIDTLTKLLNDPELRKSLIKKGFRRIKTFTWGKSASIYMDKIMEVRN